MELLEYIFTIPGVKVFLSERLSQDPLEKFFGCQRQRGTTNENPNVAQFCKNTQALRVINGVCGNVSKSNCRGNKTSFDRGKENCPLPKRRKCKPQVSSSKPSSSSQEEVLGDTVMSSSNTMKQTITLSEHQNHFVGSSSSQEEVLSDTVMSSNTMEQTITLSEHQNHFVGSSSSQEEVLSDTVMSSSNTMKQAITLSEHQNHFVGSSSSQEEVLSDTIMSSSNTMKQAITLSEHQNHFVGSSSSQEEVLSDTIMSSSNTMKQAITLSEHQNHFVGSSSSQEEVLGDTVMSSSNTMKQEKLQPLNRDKISAQFVYPSPLVQLIDDALKSGTADEELSNGFHISLKRSDFWLLHETGWLNDKVSIQ